VKRVEATIWQGVNEDLGHESDWNVQIHAPGWGNDIDHDDPGFDTLQEAYDYIGGWAQGRGVACSVSFGCIVTEPYPKVSDG
jgi:hypothetical protein